MSKIVLNRRQALQRIALSGATLYLNSCASTMFRSGQRVPAGLFPPKPLIFGGHDASPIDRSLGDVAPRVFSGDAPDLTHRLLWDKAGFLASHGGSIPEPSEEVPLVIVG